MPKTYASTFLFGKYPKYTEDMFTAIMTGKVIDKKDSRFGDIKYEVKRRQVSNNLVRVFESNNVILLLPDKALAKSLKVFAAKDLKGDKRVKTFIDVTGCITEDYHCLDADRLVAYVINAMVVTVYANEITSNKLIGNNDLIQSGAKCFAALFTYVIDYVAKISINPAIKNKCLYLSAMYYLDNICGIENEDRSRAMARKLAGITEREENMYNIAMVGFGHSEDSYLNIKTFVDTLRDVLKIPKLTLDVVVERWMNLYGPGTVFGLEFFPAFSAMLTDAYTGCYMNNQKTIEKIIGRDMTDYVKKIIAIGDGIV